MRIQPVCGAIIPLHLNVRSLILTRFLPLVKSKGLEVRFSSEDSFRSDLVDLLNIYSAVDKIGVTRVGIAE